MGGKEGNRKAGGKGGKGEERVSEREEELKEGAAKGWEYLFSVG